MPDGHTVVIGSGVVGAATAYYLAKQGNAVTLLEQGEIASGCSQGNAGQVTPGHLPLTQPGTMLRNLRWLFQSKSPLYVAPRMDPSLMRWLWQFQKSCNAPHLVKATKILCELGQASAGLFDELVGDIGLRYQNNGRLEICRSKKTLQAACGEAELLRTCGFESRRLLGDQVQQFEPAIQAEVAGAIYYPNSGYCNPHELVTQLALAAEAAGAKLLLNTSATDLRKEQGRVVAVVTPQGEIPSDALVLACGAWAPRWAQQLGMRLPVQPGKGYHLDVGRPEKSPALPVVLVEERIFVTPLNGNLRLAGTMEFSGFNLRQRPARIEMLAAGAGRYLPGVLQAEERSRWCHLRPMTPDGLPIIGRVPQVPNVWIATGHGMLGITQGPITGKLLAEWIGQGKTSFDLAPLSPERFEKRLPASHDCKYCQQPQ